MRIASVWLCVASALALSACHRPNATAAHQPAKAAAGPAQAATATHAPPIKVGAGNDAAADHAAPEAHAAKREGPAPGRPERRAAAVGQEARLSPDLASESPARRIAAADRSFSPEFDACIAAAHGFTAARASCHSAELARQNARLERALGADLATRSDEGRARLLGDQHAWIERRDAECQGARTASDVLGESSCRLDMTTERAAKLERLAG